MRSQVTPAHHRAEMCGTDQGVGGPRCRLWTPGSAEGQHRAVGLGEGHGGLAPPWSRPRLWGPPGPKLLLTSTGIGVHPPDPRS